MWNRGTVLWRWSNWDCFHSLLAAWQWFIPAEIWQGDTPQRNMAFLVSKSGRVFCVCAILSCFLSATLSNNSHFRAGLSSPHRFALISICQKATYFFSAQEINSIGKKKSFNCHSLSAWYISSVHSSGISGDPKCRTCAKKKIWELIFLVSYS